MEMNVIPDGFKMTELGMLPEEWVVVRFSDCRAKQRLKIPPSILKSEYKPTGEYPIVDQSMNFIAGYTDENEKIVRQQLPVIIFGDHTRIFKFVDFPFAIGADGTKIIFPKIEVFDPKFLYYYFLNFKIPSKGYNRHFKLLKECIVVRPPLPEQQKIANVLSTVQQAKEKTDAVISATNELKKSLMKHLFTYGPVPVKKFDEFDEFNELGVNELQNAQNSKNLSNSSNSINLKETEIGLVPEEWDIAKLGEKGHFQYGYTTSATEEDTGTKFLRITDINEDGFVNWGTVPYGCIEDENIQKFKLSEGDILFARIGATTGKTCIIGGATHHAIFGSYLIRFVSNEELYSKYVFYFTQTRRYQELVNAGKEGKLKKGLSATELKNFKIPLPPISIQQKIASILSTVDEKIEKEENKKKALEALFKTLLHDLMTAKFRVNHLEVTL